MKQKIEMSAVRSINRFFAANYVLMLANLTGFVIAAPKADFGAAVFIVSVMLAYALVYLIPAGLLLSAVRGVIGIGQLCRKGYAQLLMYAAAVLVMTLTHLVILIDGIIYRMYDFHINGFVWNLLTTKGGIESMGFEQGVYWTAGLFLLAALALEIFLLFLCIRWEDWNISRASRWPHRLRVSVPFMAAGMFGLQALLFGISSFRGNAGILAASGAFPFYMPMTFQGILKDLGFQPGRRELLTVHSSKGLALQYPLEPIRRRPDSPRWNIVWLVAESWRADMLNPEVMPRTWEFARRAQYFTNHYSGGNGTCQAMFSMFYGLYGNYWFRFLNEQRSPVLMDLLQDNGYQIDLYTSARFSYPEFDKTLFSRIPPEHLHDYSQGEGWERDRVNTGRLLDFIDRRDKDKPFMTFLFFESPHARYYFPPECEIRKDYLKDFNYATADLQRDIGRIFNRYVNSCRHLDTQFARIIDYLQQHQLLDSTVVILTGDHGEEFMEHGHWGHNSGFTEEQVRTPLVLWVPGRPAAEYAKMTSHLDIPATLMTLLGVDNPPRDYSLGFDLFSPATRFYTVLGDWDSLVYIDAECKIVLPLKATAVFNKITDADDTPAEDSAGLYSKKMANLVGLLREAGEFTTH
ncbi:MAG TPA: sulfatase-like hydrolase/transferase [Anaerohalosphaeraceae bacterium]|nr:sulfatase-like hydrolase/transferase [Anaerohalosphaeraceae bacterium]HPC64964.1 sulfatase-like hydrolase/transferase [Anaerohalosphaeraceae bacterium]HRS72174.1 sulfatase-like hydrolase/transferase [Anaerohalosphaeraceae bacterium]HRV21109.1 sulfatase-like hydrolase/transferase [Anaerohalosphaeraceae bacterium]